MTLKPPFGSSTFRLVVKGLLELHQMEQRGEDESTQAEAVRDAMDAPLDALNAEETERARWLSEDLFSITARPNAPAVQPMDPEAQHALSAAIEARQACQWDRAFTLLRRWQAAIEPALLSYLRGSVWLDAGYPEVAVTFFSHAAKVNPADGRYYALYMHALAKANPSAALALARGVIAESQNHPPAVLSQAAAILINESKTMASGEATQIYREIIPVLEQCLNDVDTDDVAEFATVASLLGFCSEAIGNTQEAVAFYSRGLQQNPDNSRLLVARGSLQYGKSPHAIADLEQAANDTASTVWPFFFLAHHALATGQFERCRQCCEAGLRRYGSDTVKSRLEEWRAIAQAELGFPPEMVRTAFEGALRLDPANELARQNQHAFEASQRSNPAAQPTPWEKISGRAVRQLSLVERRSTFAA